MPLGMPKPGSAAYLHHPSNTPRGGRYRELVPGRLQCTAKALFDALAVHHQCTAQRPISCTESMISTRGPQGCYQDSESISNGL
jgi:hypothetical protein